MRFAGGAQVGGLPGDDCGVRVTQRRGRRRQAVKRRPAAPVHLIDGPGGDRRLLQRADLGGRGARFLRERIARRRELIERELIQPIDLGIQWPGGHIGHSITSIPGCQKRCGQPA